MSCWLLLLGAGQAHPGPAEWRRASQAHPGPAAGPAGNEAGEVSLKFFSTVPVELGAGESCSLRWSGPGPAQQGPPASRAGRRRSCAVSSQETGPSAGPALPRQARGAVEPVWPGLRVPGDSGAPSPHPGASASQEPMRPHAARVLGSSRGVPGAGWGWGAGCTHRAEDGLRSRGATSVVLSLGLSPWLRDDRPSSHRDGERVPPRDPGRFCPGSQALGGGGSRHRHRGDSGRLLLGWGNLTGTHTGSRSRKAKRIAPFRAAGETFGSQSDPQPSGPRS